MSWKIYIIAISNATSIQTKDVQQALGLEKLNSKNEINIVDASLQHKTAIGKHNDQIFVVDEFSIFKFSEKTPTDVETALIKLCPNSEITVLIYNGTVDLYGYTIIKNGKRIRAKSGSDEIFIDTGEKLPEEIASAKKKHIDKDELKELQQNQTKEEIDKYIDQLISIDTVFKLTARLFGKQIDQKNSTAEKIKLTELE